MLVLQSVPNNSQGDSGGPMIQYENGEPISLGILSYGIGCGNWQFPDVYARISALVDWMAKNTSAEFQTNLS